MATYLVRRFLLMILTLFLMSILIFVMLRLVPGNIADILAAGGAGPQHLVRLTWYVVDIEEYLASLKELGRVYREIFGAHYPAMALVQVVRLVEKAARVEIEATAVVPR